MIAEIYGKISSNGTSLSDRLEDNLTGDFFGALRYLPFEVGFKEVLKNIKCFNEQDKNNYRDTINNIHIEYCDKEINFWPYDEEGELDVLIEFENLVAGIEVKYLSRLSSDDEVVNSFLDSETNNEVSINQLARESRIIMKHIKNTNKKGMLIFVAFESECIKICNDILNRNILEKDIMFAMLSWQKIYDICSGILAKGNLEKRDEIILGDIAKLLKNKGFERFKSFYYEGYDKDIVFDNLSYNVQVLNKKGFDFNIDTRVEGDKYYEFE